VAIAGLQDQQRHRPKPPAAAIGAGPACVGSDSPKCAFRAYIEWFRIGRENESGKMIPQ
jgi:hypothetical protein